VWSADYQNCFCKCIDEQIDEFKLLNLQPHKNKGKNTWSSLPSSRICSDDKLLCFTFPHLLFSTVVTNCWAAIFFRTCCWTVACQMWRCSASLFYLLSSKCLLQLTSALVVQQGSVEYDCWAAVFFRTCCWTVPCQMWRCSASLFYLLSSKYLLQLTSSLVVQQGSVEYNCWAAIFFRTCCWTVACHMWCSSASLFYLLSSKYLLRLTAVLAVQQGSVEASKGLLKTIAEQQCFWRTRYKQ